MQESNKPEIVYDKKGNPYEVVDFNNDYVASKLGFWLFLFTEFMIFGTLFLAYSFFFYMYTDSFVVSSAKLSLYLGGTNTIILLISTLTMGLAFYNLKNNNIKKCINLTYTTVVLSTIFLGVKIIEWSLKKAHGIFPLDKELLALPYGEQIYFGLYYSMTGLHGLHVIFGIGAMLWVIYLIKKVKITYKNYVVFENVALYWDFVHLVWVFVFPFFYLIY